MGNTTIIEINHDQAHEIRENEEGFVNCVLEQCAAATHTGKRIPGGRVVAFFHRSGPLDAAWDDFKEKWLKKFRRF